MREVGIEPILFKGWAAAALYPAGDPRSYGDIDLAVDPRDFTAAAEMIRSPDGQTLYVDLHRGFRHLDSRPWDEIFDASILVEVEGTMVRTPSPEDHLRLLCAHWLNDGGADKQRLWDIYYGVQNRPQDFDWENCLNGAGSERRSWVVYTIAMAHEYLGLDISALPFDASAFPDWMRKTVENEWQSGVRLIDLHACFGDWNLLRTQIRKRVPPNPIQATIEMQKSLDDPRRAYFQVRTLLRRAGQSASKFKRRGLGS